MKNKIQRKMDKDFRKYYLSMNPYGGDAFDDYAKKFVNQMSPYILEEREMHVTQMDVFSRLMADRQIFFTEDVNNVSCSIVIAQLLYLNSISQTEDIVLNIASPGGAIDYGMGLIDTIGYIDCDVKTVNLSLAASMGLVLLVAGKKGKRISLPNARFLLHQPLISGGLSGPVDDIKIEAEQLELMREKLYSFMGMRTGHTIDELKAMAPRDYWFGAEEALKLGFIDEIQKIDWSKK